MKFSSTLPTLATLLAATLIEAAPQNGGVSRQQGNKGAQLKQFGSNGGAQNFRNKNGQNGGNNANNGGNNANNNGGNNNGNNGNNNSSGGSDAADPTAGLSADELQDSLTLSPDQVQPGLAQDGQAVPVDGQVSSLTSKNNFINHCATLPNLPLTNGQQILTGSCNPTIMGQIIAKDKMPSGKIINPPNFGVVAAGESISFKIAVKNMITGNFVNANQNYFAAPQQADANGVLLAHSHITVNKISSFQDNEPADPTVFAFFKGLNDAAVNGILSADADGGLDPGFYRACTINTAANHQPALVAVAQHASLDDCTYFQVTEDGQPDDNSNNNGNNGDDAAATTTADAAAATGNAGNNGQNGNNNGQNGNNNGQNGNNNAQGGNNGQNGGNNAQNGGNNAQNGNNGAQNGNNGNNAGANKGKNNNAGANRGGSNAAAGKGKNAGANQGNNAGANQGNNNAAGKGNNNAAAAKGNNAGANKGNNNAAAAKGNNAAAAAAKGNGNNAAKGNAAAAKGNNAGGAQGNQGNRQQAQGAAGANRGQRNGNRRPFPFSGRRPSA